MYDTGFENLVAQIANLEVYSSQQARGLAEKLCQTGVASRQEAEFLIKLNRELSDTSELSSDSFQQAMVDYLLTVEAPIGWITQEECAWLMACLSWPGRLALASELELLLSILAHASDASDALGLFTLQSIYAYAIAEARITPPTVKRLRKALCRADHERAAWISHAEAVCLLKLNDALGRADNDAGWSDLFARALSNYLIAAAHPEPALERAALAREVWLKPRSFGVADFFGTSATLQMSGNWFEAIARDPEVALRAKESAREAAWSLAAEDKMYDERWISNRLGLDKSISAAERALITFLNKEAPGFTAAIVVVA